MKIEKNLELVSKLEEKVRVDQFISLNSELNRSMLSDKSVIITIDGKKAKRSSMVRLGQTVKVVFEQYVFDGIEKENIKLNILFEDKDVLVINKEQGMVVHPAPGNFTGTLVNALAYRYGNDFVEEMREDDDLTRPGIVHRLDKDTSGVMVIALNWKSHSNLALQFSSHTTEKVYNCIVKGVFLQKRGKIENYIGRNPRNRKTFSVVENEKKGKYALSYYRVIQQFKDYALVEVIIKTGRTHQIRVHMKHIGHPILGDSTYGKKDSAFLNSSMMLHARSLSFDHPTTGERIKFETELPERFNQVIKALDLITLNLR